MVGEHTVRTKHETIQAFEKDRVGTDLECGNDTRGGNAALVAGEVNRGRGDRRGSVLGLIS